MILNCRMVKQSLLKNKPFRLKKKTPFFHSDTEIVLGEINPREVYKKAVERVIENLAHFNKGGSGFVFDGIIRFDINTVEYKPLRGSSYFLLPEFLASKNTVINPKTTDNRCFKWCKLGAINPKS